MKVSAKTAYSRGYRYGLKTGFPPSSINPYGQDNEEAAEMWRFGAQAGANVKRLRDLRAALAAIGGPSEIW